MRSLGADRVPAWLLAKLGHYPSINDYDVASTKECEDYWKQPTNVNMPEQGMSSSFRHLSLEAVPLGM